MPTINRKVPNKQKHPETRTEKKSDKYYNSKAWRQLRNTYFCEHPLCEVCGKHDTITPADHVHHKQPFLDGKDDEHRWELLLNSNNLMSVCNTCHKMLHRKRDKYKLKSVDDLTDVEYREAHGVDYQ